MKTKLILFWGIAVIWMGVIFFLSSQVGDESSELSSGVTEVIKTVIETVAPNNQININDLHHIVRKNAHFFAYMFLGILVVNALYHGSISKYKCAAFGVLICLVYAASDEIHQLFVPGRGSMATDVLIDTSGSIVGITFYLLIVTIFSRKFKKNLIAKKEHLK